MYQRLLGEVSDLRQGNRRRIRKGLWALVGVTVGLLALVFISQSSKVIFLLLWIVSMFGVAASAWSIWTIRCSIRSASSRTCARGN